MTTHNDWPGRGNPPVREWQHHGLTCRIYRNPLGTLNGYVELPEDHPARHLDLQWDDCEVFDVHGGITYGGRGRRVIGFDTLHAGDHIPTDVAHFTGGDAPGEVGRRWSEDDVAAETNHLADQIHGAPDPGPWPYLALVTFAALAATCILIANYI